MVMSCMHKHHAAHMDLVPGFDANSSSFNPRQLSLWQSAVEEVKASLNAYPDTYCLRVD